MIWQAGSSKSVKSVASVALRPRHERGAGCCAAATIGAAACMRGRELLALYCMHPAPPAVPQCQRCQEHERSRGPRRLASRTTFSQNRICRVGVNEPVRLRLVSCTPVKQKKQLAPPIWIIRSFQSLQLVRSTGADSELLMLMWMLVDTIDGVAFGFHLPETG